MAGAKFIIIVNSKVYKWEFYGNYTLNGLGKKIITQLKSKPIQEIIDWIKSLPEDFTQDYEFYGDLFSLTALGSEINNITQSDEEYEMLYSYTIDFDSGILNIWCKESRIGALIDFNSDMHSELLKLISLEKKLS